MAKPYIRLDKDNAAVLLVDHQAGLLSLVRDIDPDKFKNNVLALAAAAKYFNLPTILTTSFEEGPNGPLVPELVEMFPHAPYIARPGQINAWDNEDFVQAVKATGKKQLIIAGVVTEVCVAFPALSALEEEFDVFVITDASGTFNPITRDAAWDRMSQAGVMVWGSLRITPRLALEPIMHSFDDYYYFYLVVKHGGFSAASDASNITKSKLSRRILDLEAKYNVTLIQRSTRHFKVTPLGQELFEECRQIIQQVESAHNVLLKQKSEPQGLIKISCPSVMMRYQVQSLLNHFLKQYPKVQVEMELTSRRVDVLHDDIDLAIRTNFSANEDSSIMVRDVVKTTHCLVASPDLLQGREIQFATELNDFPTLALGVQKSNYQWLLHHTQSDEQIVIPLEPRVKSNDVAGVYYSALDGLGIANLPYLTVEADIASGRLIHILPDWCSNIGTVQLVYASRKGQRLVMEKLIEHLIQGLRDFASTSKGYHL
ncbi:hypothetical protein LTR94_022900 [Friedmanniomyces endolithicus]|nr:hypothetical protein LTR94_022900 [Friedmanniomyces endolithicus]